MNSGEKSEFQLPKGGVEILNPYTGEMQLVFDLKMASEPTPDLELDESNDELQRSQTQAKVDQDKSIKDERAPQQQQTPVMFNPYLENPYLPTNKK